MKGSFISFSLLPYPDKSPACPDFFVQCVKNKIHSVQNTVYALNDMFLSLNFEPLREQRKNAHLKGTVR